MILTPIMPATTPSPVDVQRPPPSGVEAAPTGNDDATPAGRHDVDLADSGFAAALSQFLPPPSALAHGAEPVANAAAASPSASTTAAATSGG